ncbi:MarR family winged helix-turn-helix transcriptional regulator [Acrocarpospora macrocephala]|uniref:MarR family transcriptional regulator n=1 Tax=Acrocarpospora macrocephala TaxID=150177 RepID=A0A5M3WSZ5_9ACTN|nr:MarR family transcriptional regulator [Acrocarpospora macrocephala]GES12004.1 MarR family transcriptional regulator [Acrocarpospora macrocephala]
MTDASTPRRLGFLLTQLGTFASARFAERVRDLGLVPSDAGVLRLLSRNPGMSQRDLAGRLGTVPSRVVVLIDSLEGRGLVARTRSPSDRRNHELRLTDAGRTTMGALRGIAEAHEHELFASLDDEERRLLQGILAKLAADFGLDTEVHPGYSERGQ